MAWLHIGHYESCVPLACPHTAGLRLRGKQALFSGAALATEDRWRGRVRERTVSSARKGGGRGEEALSASAGRVRGAPR